ncbi:hypothetical protein GF348_24345 [candidate division KSB3 bacterium]|nr:hypothetical protein [candidate division KSB3 bacterium]
MNHAAAQLPIASARIIRRVVEFFFGDGVIQGLARCALAAAYGVSIAFTVHRGCRQAEHAWPLLLVAAFAAVFALLVGLRHLAITALAPDGALWHDEGGLRWWRRIALTALRLCLTWGMLSAVMHGVLIKGGHFALLPLIAYPLQWAGNRRRSDRSVGPPRST